jgi:aryl-alcohol dehydrogenase-like predicted oxidoreductase
VVGYATPESGNSIRFSAVAETVGIYPGWEFRVDYRVLGRTGVKVSPLCLGAMMFGTWGADLEQSANIVEAALDAGINMIDTADMYSNGESEEIVGKVISGRRDSIVLATKFNGRMGPDVNDAGNSARWVVRACEASLRRLGTDYIDLYQIHRPDAGCDLDETLGALERLIDQGKIRYVGTSTFPASTIVEARWLADSHRLPKVVTEQPPYSMLSRGIEVDVLPTCERYGIGVLAWSPLSGGWLSGRWRAGAETARTTRAKRVPARWDLSIPANVHKLAAVEQLAQVAEETGMTLIHLAIAFVIQHPAVTAAIIGPRTVEHLQSQVGAVDVVLDSAVLDRIDKIVTPGTNFSWADVWAPPSIENPSLRRRP